MEVGGHGYFPPLPVWSVDAEVLPSWAEELKRRLNSRMEASRGGDIKWGPDDPDFIGLSPSEEKALPSSSFILALLDREGVGCFFRGNQRTVDHLRALNRAPPGRNATQWALGWSGLMWHLAGAPVLCLFKLGLCCWWHLPTNFAVRDPGSVSKRCTHKVKGLSCPPPGAQLKHTDRVIARASIAVGA